MNTTKIAYKPVGFALGIVGGMLATAAFKRAWKALGHEGEAPEATDEHRTWPEVLTAAVLQGAIFAGVRAAVDRGGAAATRRITGVWPR
ncbi:DUF4235 domain-containing protein [Streptomyces sp. PmtG]